jgi:cob(I)alamin adenosyltransferase
MVRLDKIYTRGGDKGETSLSDGSRVAKHDLRVEAYGTVDEVNAHIGVARLYSTAESNGEIDAILGRIQNDLFDLGADLARPINLDTTKPELRIIQSQIDMNAALSPLTSFILPGGTVCAAHLHVARTVTRRAERLTTKLSERNAKLDKINPLAVIFLNRLSDLLFVLSRKVNDNGLTDVLWEPGKNR